MAVQSEVRTKVPGAHALRHTAVRKDAAQPDSIARRDSADLLTVEKPPTIMKIAVAACRTFISTGTLTP